METITSLLVDKGICPKCDNGAYDDKALAYYDDGHTYCFSCGDYQMEGSVPAPKVKVPTTLLTNGVYCNINAKGLSKEVCEKFRIQVGTYESQPVVIFNRYRGGALVAQKIRTLDKKFTQLGAATDYDMFGSHFFDDPTDKHLIITEGEFDAAACMMVELPHTYHCTSLDNGSTSVKKFIEKYYTQLMKYKDIILCFDEDDAGREAVNDFVKLFTYLPIKIAKLPCNDASDMLLNNMHEVLKWALIKAPVHVPVTIQSVNNILEQALEKPLLGYPWPWEAFTKITYGLRPSLIVIYGPEGTGKTEMGKEIMEHNISQDPIIKCGMFSFEQQAHETLQRLVGSKLGVKLYLPGVAWPDNVEETMRALEDRVFFFDAHGTLNFDDIVRSIIYLANIKKVRFFWIDNLTAMLENPYIAAKRVTNYEYLTHVMSVLNRLKRELGLVIVLITHNHNDNFQKQVYVSTSPKDADEYLSRSAEDMQEYINRPGMTWETGRMATLENISGADTIKKLADIVIALARNRFSPDPMNRRTLRCKFLKNRIDSAYDGVIVDLIYDPERSKLTQLGSTLDMLDGTIPATTKYDGAF